MNAVKNTFKRFVSVLLSMGIALSLCGCVANVDFTTEDFLVPPKPAGDMLDIRQALEESVEEKFTLKYPTDGDYRSAYIMADLMEAGEKEFALAFYSTLSSDNVATMHLNLMKKVDDSWLSISDSTMAAVGVEKVILSDMNADGISEIIVGWNVYGNVDKRVTVYQIKGLSLVPLMQEAYTKIICSALEQSEKKQLLVLNHNSGEGIATAKLYGLDANDLYDLGSCKLDGSVTYFYEPVATKLSNGKPAVFIDAAIGNGTHTEILSLQSGKLSRADLVAGENGGLLTYRNSATLCTDINSDGIYDIPIIESQLSYIPGETSQPVAGMVKWCGFDGINFTVTLFAAMNYSDGYYLEIPIRWFGKTTIETNVESRQYTVFVWDTENGTKLGELFKLRTVTDAEWDKSNNGLEAYSEVARGGNLVYVAAVGNHQGEEKTSLDEIKTLVHIIG